MALTPAGATTPWVTATDLTNRYDVRTLGDYLSDTGTRLTPAQVTASVPLAAILAEASGKFESCCMRGQRYQLVDLQALQAQVGSNGWQLVVGIICGWAAFLVWQRRPQRFTEDELPLSARQAVADLQALADGEAILPFLETAEAGVTQNYVEQWPDVVAREGAAVQAQRFFGRRGNEYPWQ